MPAVEPRKGMSKKGGECLALPTFSRHGKVQVNLTLLIWLIENVALLTLRAWTQMGKEIKEERIEYKREGAMSFRAVANQTNGRRKARQKANER